MSRALSSRRRRPPAKLVEVSHDAPEGDLEAEFDNLGETIGILVGAKRKRKPQPLEGDLEAAFGDLGETIGILVGAKRKSRVPPPRECGGCGRGRSEGERLDNFTRHLKLCGVSAKERESSHTKKRGLC